MVARARAQQDQLELSIVELDCMEFERCQLRSTLHPWDPPSRKEPLWELERQISSKRQEIEALVESVVSLLSQALESGLMEQGEQAHSRLADLYWMLFSRAEERHDLEQQDRYLELLSHHDDGRYADLIEGTATLQVETDPDGARVTLHSLSTDARGIVSEDRGTSLGKTPVDPIDVAPGTYLLKITLSGYAPVRRPIHVQRGSDIQIHVRLFSSREVGPDYVYIPAGRFYMGGDDEALSAGAGEKPFVDNFAMARYPVTVGEYMLFLDDLAAKDPGQALSYAPLPTPGGAQDPRLPVTGISYEAAATYCSWLSARTGLVFRLPCEAEWEKVARGADSRIYPWGHVFDPSFCKMRHSRPGAPSREQVGRFPTDLSIYGVRDLAGGVSEWTRSLYDEENQLQVVRGGAYDDGAQSCRCASRLGATRQAHPSIGFRLVRPLSPGGGDRMTPGSVPALPVELDVLPPDPQQRRSLQEALDHVHVMSRRLAASESPEELLPQLLSETIQLVQAERGLVYSASRVLEARTARGEMLPTTDQGFDTEVLVAALRQQRTIELCDRNPVLAVPLPDRKTCLLLERRFNRSRFSEESVVLAQSAADVLALVIRLVS